MGGLRQGVRAAAMGSIAGAGLGAIAGVSMQGLWMLEDALDPPKLRQERLLAKELAFVKRQKAALLVTDMVIGDLEHQLKGNSTSNL